MNFVEGNTPQRWTRGKVLFVSLAVRFTLILYSNIHDYVFHVNFTDVDYNVYSDAARHVAAGESPFKRVTYRYTPALAWILLPNNKYRDFGKYLFCIFDVIVGWMHFEILDRKSRKYAKLSNSTKTRSSFLRSREDSDDQSDDRFTQAVVLFWLANPSTAIISARGNADVLVCAAVLFTLYLLDKGHWLLAALAHGMLAVHLKIYPIIYLPSIFLHLCRFSACSGISDLFKQLFTNWKGFTYVAVCTGSFALIVVFFYRIYGDNFIEEFLLYHIKRRDIRHNFSPYFYLLYLIDGEETISKVVGFFAFLPQLFLIVYFAFRYHDDLPFCWFLTTFAFVTFNKVCTSQYFVWYIVLLPLIMGRVKLPLKEVALLISMWFASQGLWLLFAYLFEFEGWHTFEWMWAASMVFLLVNSHIMTKLIRAYLPPLASSKIKDE
ncbi:hypothetical protein KIN20_031878 [Parelaphostrongylus tenuis]|uniref:GPI alpha-1,4-mannosyltransferase I, catalytic subunit n=1 Tax=Parelaphostrongylus tenuis TaxID=148309 RepID=A0AAD5R5P7_PARTN|nr:hypothetical protein KIN20_031878 [Parelaphostrongylus tenuis]